MMNFYSFYNRSDLDNNEYGHSLEIFDDWWYKSGGQLQHSDIENILHIIKKSTECAFGYAKLVIQGRWKDAEPYIMKNPQYACWYVADIIKGRWIEAEPYIMKDPYHAYWYSINIIRGRWEIAEDVLKQDKTTWVEYCNEFSIPLE